MKQQADLQLLSLLEKIANPLTEVDLKLTLKGIYAPAEQWYISEYSGSRPMKLIPIFSHTALLYLAISSLQGK